MECRWLVQIPHKTSAGPRASETLQLILREIRDASMDLLLEDDPFHPSPSVSNQIRPALPYIPH